MRHYQAVVTLAGHAGMEAIRPRVSAAEIYVLRHLHGQDAVRGRELEAKADEPAVSNSAERDRLASRYGAKAVVSLFGGQFGTLPTEVSDLPPLAGSGRVVDIDALEAKIRVEIEAKLRMEAAALYQDPDAKMALAI